MTSALKILHEEHRDLLRIIAALEAMAKDDAELTHAATLEKLTSILHFLRVYPCAIHHPKEEALYPKMAAADLSFALGYAALLKDHAISYALIRNIDLARIKAASPEGAARLKEAILDYVGHKRRHIAREEQVILPLAERVLDATTLADLRASFAAQSGPAIWADLRREFESIVAAENSETEQTAEKGFRRHCEEAVARMRTYRRDSRRSNPGTGGFAPFPWIATDAFRVLAMTTGRSFSAASPGAGRVVQPPSFFLAEASGNSQMAKTMNSDSAKAIQPV
jgi:hemerythrin-like domain-containing protein